MFLLQMESEWKEDKIMREGGRKKEDKERK